MNKTESNEEVRQELLEAIECLNLAASKFERASELMKFQKRWGVFQALIDESCSRVRKHTQEIADYIEQEGNMGSGVRETD